MLSLNPYFKGTTLGPLSEVIYQNKQNYKNFTFRVLPEILFSIPVAMYFPKNHYLVNEVNSKISLLDAAGIIEWLTLKYLGALKIEPADSTGPRKLNLEQLIGGIYIYAGGCVCGFLCLFLEKLVEKAKPWL